ncbi:phage tail protein [Paracoccus liaowanqingii]|uniref:Phage tail protein n=1 Tax=Paracoccus liaowanqingii TaxID=2560053 RepID=A0A4P7HLW2_9RHOB|nr:phage tail protein [Paracoccus liaowanqingii]QBX35176.1 phage tail protein [Paracoccus liaowanqingii]
MSCLPNEPRFRLLDHLTGWDEYSAQGLTGLGDDGGVRMEGGLEGLTPDAIDPYIPLPALAPGCNPYDWYLAARAAPASTIRALDGCSNKWREAWPRGCVPVAFGRAVAVAVDRHRVAVADAAAGRVWVLLLKGARILAEIAVDAPRDVSFGPAGEIVVAAHGGTALLRFTPNGRPLGAWLAALPEGRIARIAHDAKGRLWLAVEAGADRFTLHAQETVADPAFVPRDADDLTTAFTRTAMLRSDRSGFCLLRGDGHGTETTFCWDWFGRSIAADCVGSAEGAAFARQGQLLTRALDSGIPRCRWHRLILDAEIPAGTRLGLAVATSETALPTAQGTVDPDWAGFAPGLPHPGDWQVIEPGQLDALIRTPPGRYLFLRLRLSGDGSATPRVRRIHIDFPRATSADLLPSVYREEGVAGDFTERFLSLFDASLGMVDAAVAQFPALIDGARARDEVLPWIARFLAVSLDETWDAATRRRILRAAPDLFRRRGTRAGLAASIRLAYDLSDDPAITEHGLERNWGAVAASGAPGPADARLGRTRLFSRKSARLTLGVSPLGRTPVMSYGDPAADPHTTGAFRFTVAVPSGVGAQTDALSRLVDGQKPAHTLAVLSVGSSTGFRLGGALRIGIDTLIAWPAPHVLGTSRGQLGHTTILGGSAPPGPVLGRSTLTSPPAAQPMSCPE